MWARGSPPPEGDAPSRPAQLFTTETRRTRLQEERITVCLSVLPPSFSVSPW